MGGRREGREEGLSEAWRSAPNATRITMAAPTVADNRPRRDLDSWKIDSQV